MQAPRLRVLSYNIHQGITATRNRLTLDVLKAAIRSLDADVVLLQEVAGSELEREAGRNPVRLSSQLAALADEVWPHHAFGTNAVFTSHFHGNAILSRHRIEAWHNERITIGNREPRGILHGVLDIPGEPVPVHALAIHLGLSQRERAAQARKLREYVERRVPARAPLVVGGDFNDWRKRISRELSGALGMREAFRVAHRRYARTYPSRFPILHLDRIYFRGCAVESARRCAGKPWRSLSDHLPLVADFRLDRAAGAEQEALDKRPPLR